VDINDTVLELAGTLELLDGINVDALDDSGSWVDCVD
jgi:hypothetical protein